jgi:hypothetical protein
MTGPVASAARACRMSLDQPGATPSESVECVDGSDESAMMQQSGPGIDAENNLTQTMRIGIG